MEPPPWRVALSAATMVVVPLVIWAVIAGLAVPGVRVSTGGQATFKQVFAVVVHSAVVSAVGTVIMTPVNYFRESLSSATNLGVFLPFLPEGSFLARLAGHGGRVRRLVGDGPGHRPRPSVTRRRPVTWRSACSACTG